jgi:hypothetical protein
MRHLARLAEKRKFDLAQLLAALQVMPLDWSRRRVRGPPLGGEARDRGVRPGRLADAGAGAGVPIWSRDKDFVSAGVEVVRTGELLDALRGAGYEPQ